MKVFFPFLLSFLGLENLAEVPGSESRPGSLLVCKTCVENGMPGLMVECEGLPTRADLSKALVTCLIPLPGGGGADCQVLTSLTLFYLFTHLSIPCFIFLIFHYLLLLQNQGGIFNEDARGIQWRILSLPLML